MKKDVPVALAAVVVVLGLCFALGTMRPDLPPTPSVPFSTIPGTSTPAPGSKTNDRVVMRVNGEPVTEREFDAFLQQAPEQMQAYYAGPDGRRLLAQQMVKLKALEQEGRRLGVEREPDAAGRIEMARANIVAAFTLQKMVSQPSDQRLRAQWEKEKKNFETVQLSHILISYQGGSMPPKSGAPPPTLADAMRKADNIERRLHGGADFAQLAKSESDDVSSGAQGGRIGDVPTASLPPEVQTVVAGMKAQEISRPVKSAYGIHIFKSGVRTVRTYEELKQTLAAKMQRDEAEAALGRLQKSAKVELDPKFFRPENPPAPRGRS